MKCVDIELLWAHSELLFIATSHFRKKFDRAIPSIAIFYSSTILKLPERKLDAIFLPNNSS